MDSITLTLKNYSRLRDKHPQMEMPRKGMSTIDASLELLRILFMINDLLNLGGLFITKFEELLKKEQLFCKHSACKVKSALIRSCVYEVFETGKDGSSCSVKLWITDKCCIIIPEEKLYYLVKECDIIVEQLIEQHRESSFTKCEGHYTSCLICRCGNMGVFKSSVTPIQECTDVKSNDIVSSLDADTNNNQPEESTDDSDEPSTSQASEYGAHKPRGISESSDLDTEDSQSQETKDDSKEPSPSQASECSAHKPRGISESPNPDTEASGTTELTNTTDQAMGLCSLLGGDGVDGPEEQNQPEDNTSATTEFEELRAKRTNDFQDFYKRNEKKIKREMKSCGAKCILLFWNKAKKDVECKLFPHKQDGLKWIHERENRELLDDYFPFIHTLVVPENTGELKITDLKCIKIDLINPSTGLDCATQTASFDTASGIASVPYHHNFKQLIHGTMHINDAENASTIVFAQIKINGEMIDEIFPIEIETDEEWCAIGLGQMEKLKTKTKLSIMQKISNIVIKR